MLTIKERSERLLLLNELMETIEVFIPFCDNEFIRAQLVIRLKELILKYEYNLDII